MTRPSTAMCDTGGYPALQARRAGGWQGRPWAVAAEEHSYEYGSTRDLLLCGPGGMLHGGLTHAAIVLLDLVKCRMQVDPGKYKGLPSGCGVTALDDGLCGLARGWAPTFFGYSMQGLCKFGLYEVFTIRYAELLGPEKVYKWRTSLYLTASASAEFFAHLVLASMAAVKVRIQTQPGSARSLRAAAPRMCGEEGLWAFHKGVAPLWMTLWIPCTAMRSACLEPTGEALYQCAMPKPRSQCTKAEQLAVTFVASNVAGIFCAVSPMTDSVVSVLNKEKGSTALGVLRKLGFGGVWKGLCARIVMPAPRQHCRGSSMTQSGSVSSCLALPSLKHWNP